MKGAKYSVFDHFLRQKENLFLNKVHGCF